MHCGHNTAANFKCSNISPSLLKNSTEFYSKKHERGRDLYPRVLREINHNFEATVTKIPAMLQLNMTASANLHLSKYTLSTLNHVGILCGIIGGQKKSDRIQAIIHHVEFIKKLKRTLPLRHLNILSIDIGLKNFSYCKTSGIDLLGDSKVDVDGDWSKINLHERYGTTYQPLSGNMDSLIDSKKYLSHLSYHLIKDLVLESSKKPDVIVVETQRTRSNNNSVTLPNVLLNYTFENMLYSNYYTLSKCNEIDIKKGSVIFPMISNTMANFWLNRFVSKSSLAKNSKKLRIRLFFNWLMNYQVSPFTLVNFPLDKDFRKLSTKKQSAKLLEFLNLDNEDKIDDLVDSLLYNLTIKSQLRNSLNLLELLANEEDLNEFVYSRNCIHLKYLKDVLSENKLDMNVEFDGYVK